MLIESWRWPLRVRCTHDRSGIGYPCAMSRTCQVGAITIGAGCPLTIIAGPCTLESFDLAIEVGTRLRDRCAALGLPFVFKASFDKANRSSVTSARGPGLADGLAALAKVRDQLGVPITTDLHDPSQADSVAEVVDMLQIPAFLCRQTDLLVAAGAAAKEHGRAVNVKKGQFLSPGEMAGPVRKLAQVGCENVLLTERGTFFGYHRLVNDFIGLGDMMELDTSNFSDAGSPPVCFDVTHSTQLPGSGEQTGGRPDRAALLARAAAASGVHALFIEAHPEPCTALSDGATQLTIDAAERVLDQVAAIRAALGLDGDAAG
jgi:2-dehydro-3-deoxyphosphooctonate aldolase (KDO 8-P synthase)